MPGTHVHTTVQIFIVVVMPGTYVTTTVQKFIVVVSAATAVSYDCTEIYRRSQRGYRCSYDCTEIYRRSYCRLRSIPTTVQLFIVRMMMMIQKVALKSLKIAYVVV